MEDPSSSRANPASDKLTHSYESRPFYKRPAFYPVALALIVSWWLDSSIAGWAYSGARHSSFFAAFGAMILFLALAMALCLAWLTYVFLIGSLCNYSAAVGDGAVTVFVEPIVGRHYQFTVRSADIDYLEHFTPSDRQSLVCHLKNGRTVEIPLWALPGSADSIIATLKSENVKVLTI